MKIGECDSLLALNEVSSGQNNCKKFHDPIPTLKLRHGGAQFRDSYGARKFW